MTINLRQYLSEENANTIESFGYQRLLDGCAVELNGRVHHIQMSSYIFPNPQGTIIKVLAFRIHTDISLCIENYILLKGSQRMRRDIDDSIPENGTTYPSNTEQEKKVSFTFDLLKHGSVVSDSQTPRFSRQLTDKETELLAKNCNFTIATPPSSGWSNEQKAIAFLTTLLLLSGITYGAHRKGWIPSRNDIASFIEQKRASVAEMWREWQRQPEPQTKV